MSSATAQCLTRGTKATTRNEPRETIMKRHLITTAVATLALAGTAHASATISGSADDEANSASAIDITHVDAAYNDDGWFTAQVTTRGSLPGGAQVRVYYQQAGCADRLFAAAAEDGSAWFSTTATVAPEIGATSATDATTRLYGSSPSISGLAPACVTASVYSDADGPADDSVTVPLGSQPLGPAPSPTPTAGCGLLPELVGHSRRYAESAIRATPGCSVGRIYGPGSAQRGRRVVVHAVYPNRDGSVDLVLRLKRR